MPKKTKKQLKEELDKALSNSSLNEISMASLFSLFHLSKSPLLPIMNKMATYSSFNAFIGDAFQTKVSDFIPELVIED